MVRRLVSIALLLVTPLAAKPRTPKPRAEGTGVVHVYTYVAKGGDVDVATPHGPVTCYLGGLTVGCAASASVFVTLPLEGGRVFQFKSCQTEEPRWGTVADRGDLTKESLPLDRSIELFNLDGRRYVYQLYQGNQAWIHLNFGGEPAGMWCDGMVFNPTAVR